MLRAVWYSVLKPRLQAAPLDRMGRLGGQNGLPGLAGGFKRGDIVFGGQNEEFHQF